MSVSAELDRLERQPHIVRLLRSLAEHPPLVVDADDTMRLAAILLGLSVGAAPVIAADLPAPWVELAADGALSIRAVVSASRQLPRKR